MITTIKLVLGLSILVSDLPPVVPDLKITPGEVRPNCTIEDICPHLKFSRPSMSSKMRSQIYNEYEMGKYCSQKFPSGSSICEVDHLVAIELCGATTVDNLWPQSYVQVMGAHTKDRLENKLHSMVCKGEISLEEAQQDLRYWLESYKEYVE